MLAIVGAFLLELFAELFGELFVEFVAVVAAQDVPTQSVAMLLVTGLGALGGALSTLAAPVLTFRDDGDRWLALVVGSVIVGVVLTLVGRRHTAPGQRRHPVASFLVAATFAFAFGAARWGLGR